MQNTATSISVGVMFICSKIGAKSFGDGSQDIRKDKKVFWDQLQTFQAEIIKGKLYSAVF